MNRELWCIEEDLAEFMESEEMRLTQIQYKKLDALLIRVQQLQENNKRRYAERAAA